MPLRLADPVIAEIRSDRQIEVMALVLWFIERLRSDTLRPVWPVLFFTFLIKTTEIHKEIQEASIVIRTS